MSFPSLQNIVMFSHYPQTNEMSCPSLQNIVMFSQNASNDVFPLPLEYCVSDGKKDKQLAFSSSPHILRRFFPPKLPSSCQAYSSLLS